MPGLSTLALAAIIYSTLLVAAIQVKVPLTAPRRGGNPEAATIRNPVPSSPESVATGKRVFSRLCVRCHGPLGKGDGGGAGAGGQPSDLTDGAWDFGSSDGEIFSVIHDGTSADMEAYAEQISDADIWNLVNYIRSIGSKNGPQSHRGLGWTNVEKPSS
jgi:mono/diheme cytochrome c family protein